MSQPKENLDVEPTDAGWQVLVALPGVSLSEVSIDVSDNELRIATSTTDSEATSGFSYRLALPADVATEAVTTSMRDDVLTVLLPRREPKIASPQDPQADLQQVDVLAIDSDS